MRRLDPNDPADRVHIARNASALGMSAGIAALTGFLLLVGLTPHFIVRVIGWLGLVLAAIIIWYFVSLWRFVKHHPEKATQIRFQKAEDYARLSPGQQSLRLLAVASFLFFPAVLMVGGVMERSSFERFVVAPGAIAVALALVVVAALLISHSR